MCKNLFTPKKEISKMVYIGAGFSSFLVIIGIWSLLSYGGFINPLFLPAPDLVIKTAVGMFQSGDIFFDIGISFYRVVMGFLLAALIGVPLGMLMGTLRIMEGMFEPMIGFIRYMPASAFIPLFILVDWFGGNREDGSYFFRHFLPTYPNGHGCGEKCST